MTRLNKKMIDALANIISKKNIELVEKGADEVSVKFYNLKGEYEGYINCLKVDFNEAFMTSKNPSCEPQEVKNPQPKKRNVTTITITYIKDHGKSHELYCNEFLRLRTARRAGDSERVNNYQLGVLRRHRGEDLQFTEER